MTHIALLSTWIAVSLSTSVLPRAAGQDRVEENPVVVSWMADGVRFWYAAGSSSEREFLVVDPRTNSVSPVFDTPKLRERYEELTGRSAPRDGLPFSSFRFVEDEQAARFRIKSREYRWTFAEGSLEQVEREASGAEEGPRKVRDGILSGEPAVMEAESPDGRWFAGIEEANVVLRSRTGGAGRTLTEEGTEAQPFDMAEARWSPDSSRIAVLRRDERRVVKLPVMSWLGDAESVKLVPYAKPSQPLVGLGLHILGVDGGQVEVDVGEDPEVYLHPLSWRPDGSEFFLHRTRRDFKQADLLAADPDTGSTRVVVSETYSTFIDPTWSINTAPSFRFIAGGAQFLWLSEFEGWNHIYLHDSDGALVRRLTDGERPVIRVIEVDEERGQVFYSAHGEPERPYDTQIFAVGLEGGPARLLSHRIGVHDFPPYLAELGVLTEGVTFSPSLEFLVTTGSTVLEPPRTELWSTEGELIRVLARRGLDEDELARRPEPFVVLAADGETELHGLLYRPDGHDPSTSLPVIDYIYGGPQTTWVPHTFGAFQHWMAQSFADLGFAVVIVDGRGTPERGKAFQDVVHGNFGRHEIPDHVAAIRQLADERSWMDLERVGVTGGSFGGYMTLRAMLQAPEFFKVGVAVAPVAALEDVAAAAAESYLGLPANDPEAYAYASCLNKAKQLQGELMIIHGTADVNAPFGSTVKMVDALLRAGKDFEFVMLPDEPHWSTPRYGDHIDRVTREFLVEHLTP